MSSSLALEPSRDESPSAVPYVRLDSSNPRVPTYKWWSVFNIFCCCLPLGLVAVFYSGEVEERMAKRDFEGAKSASMTAKSFNFIALLIGLAVYGFLIYYFTQSYVSTTSQDNQNSSIYGG